jgi:hypothetical protein
LSLLVSHGSPANAYFERLFVSARAVSLGGAFVAVADDPSAIVINTAGLAQITSLSFLSSVDRPYELSDLRENYIAAVIPTKIGSVGLSWHRFALQDVTSEDLFTIAFGGDYIRNSQDASLSFGGSIDIARVGYSRVYTDSKTVVTGSLSVLLRPFPIIGIGYSIRNLGQPSFDWVAGDGKTNLKTTQAFGFAYHWERRATFVYERAMAQNGPGVEIDTGKRLRIRGGLNDGDVTGGLGLTVSRIIVDAGVAGHHVMGLTYYISLGLSFPSKQTGEYPDG